MENKKLKFKYHLNLWKTLPDYPTREDILFEISSHLETKGQEEFSQQTLDHVFRNNEGVEKVTIEKLISEMIVEDVITNSKTTGGDKEWYKINENPFN